MASKASLNATAWAVAETNLTDTFAHDFSGDASFATAPTGDALALSEAAFEQYSVLLLVPPPPPVPPAPACHAGAATPAGYVTHAGGYWKAHSKSGGSGSTLAKCAAVCNAAKAGCVAFELSATCNCFVFSSAAGSFIKNPQCRTFVKKPAHL